MHDPIVRRDGADHTKYDLCRPNVHQEETFMEPKKTTFHSCVFHLPISLMFSVSKQNKNKTTMIFSVPHTIIK